MRPGHRDRMNDMSTCRLLWKDVHFTRGPYVSGGLAAVTGQQPDQRRLDGPAIPSYKFSLFSRWTTFLGFSFLFRLTFGAGGSSEVARWWSVTASGILREQPCVHVSMCPSADGSRFQAARAKWYRWDVSKTVFNLCVICVPSCMEIDAGMVLVKVVHSSHGVHW